MNLELPFFGCRGYAKWLPGSSVATPWCEHCGHQRWSQGQGFVLPIWELFLPCSLWMFFFPRWRWYTLDIEWLYWGSEKGLSSSVFSRFGGGWFSLSVEIPLPAGQWFHTHPGPLWSHPALKWASSDWGHGWVWHLDPGQDRRVGCGSPDLERVRSSSWKWIPEFKSLV